MRYGSEEAGGGGGEGHESRGEFLAGALPSMRWASVESDVPLTGGDWLSLSASESWLLMVATFPAKKEANISAERFVSGE